MRNESRPDGWICQDPNGWYHWGKVSLLSDYAVFLMVATSGPEAKSFKSFDDREAAIEDAKRKGWKARPFKFLDKGEG